jgi:hypothetical protein
MSQLIKIDVQSKFGIGGMNVAAIITKALRDAGLSVEFATTDPEPTAGQIARWRPTDLCAAVTVTQAPRLASGFGTAEAVPR